MSSESRPGHREFIRRGGEWWRFRNRHGWTSDRRTTLCAWSLGAHALVGMPEATRLSVRRVPTTGRRARATGMLIGLGALGDRWSQGWGRSSEWQRRKRYERGERVARRQAPERAAHLLVRPQRLVQGRAGPPGQPPGPPVGRQPHLHRHLTRAPLARRGEPARADPADPVRAVLRTLRRRRLRRGPGPALHPPHALRDRRRPPLDGPADRGPAQRVLAQRPHAGAARLPRQLARPLRGPSLIEPMQRWLVPTPSATPAAAGSEPAAPANRARGRCPGRSSTCWSPRP